MLRTSQFPSARREIKKAFSQRLPSVNLNSAKNFSARIVSGWMGALFLSFVFGFAVRAIPEVLSIPYPVGHDPIYYAWRIKSGVIWYHWSQAFSTWLLEAILISFYRVTQIDPFILVKFTAVLLFGFDACGIYFFATKTLEWTTKKGLFAAAFFSLQIAALALSSNFYRNMLGLGILLFALSLIKNGFKNMGRFLVFALLSTLVVFSHEFGAVILFAVVLGFVISRFLKRTNINVPRVLIGVLPAIALFLAIFIVFPTRYNFEPNVILIDEPYGNYQGALFFMKNYLWTNQTAQIYPMYLDLASHVFSLFMSLYLLILPLILVGFFRQNVLNSWTALLLVGAFSALATPFFALDYWYRWMLLLVCPFTFYAVNGITKVLEASRKATASTLHRLRRKKLWETAVKLILILPLSLGLIFMNTAVQGTALPLSDIEDTIRALEWVNAQMDDHSALLAQNIFVNWARLYVDDRYTLVHFGDNLEKAVAVAAEHDFSRLYFIWWKDDIGLHGLTIPTEFAPIFSSGRVSIFEYT